VWLDALTNYLTVLGYPHNPSIDEEIKNTIHIIGKDITKFHTIYWPFFLSEAGFPFPSKVITHGHWLKDNVKMSKSLGNVVCPIEVLSKFGPDSTRIYLLANGPYTKDMSFNPESLMVMHNNFLIDGFINMITRIKNKKIVKNLDQSLCLKMISHDKFS
jgi:methionyl-tRNA synthetase